MLFLLALGFPVAVFVFKACGRDGSLVAGLKAMAERYAISQDGRYGFPMRHAILMFAFQVQVPEGAAVPELVKLKMETEAKLAEAALVWG